MGSFVEDRKRRVSLTARLVSDALEKSEKANFNTIVNEIMFQTGVTDKKAREYLMLIIHRNKLETEVEQTKKGLVYWIKIPRA